jgi:hypothetical protein
MRGGRLVRRGSRSSRDHHAKTQPPTQSCGSTAVIELTAVEDGRSHRVEGDAYSAGLVAGAGRYTTMCGRTVLAAAMTTAPGRMCRWCRDA